MVPRIALSVFIGIALALLVSLAAEAREFVTLKLNEYHIVYAHPTLPYLDLQNRLMVPLRSVSELLGAAVAYEPSSKSIEIAMPGHKVKLTTGSRTAMVDDNQVLMDTVPVLDGR